MNTSRNLLWLVRREVWEHRSLWIAPTVMAGVLLLLAAFGGVHFGDGSNFSFGTSDRPDFSSLSPEQRQHAMEAMGAHKDFAPVIGGIYFGLTVSMLGVLGIVVFFYLLDCVLAERRDRSILFWKSMPVSDGEVVTSKALTALVAAPLFTLLASAVLLVLVSGVMSVRLSEIPVSPWNANMWLQVQAAMLMFVPMVVLWYLPIAGYLLVVSVWARKNAFLWAVLPWVAVLIIEALITRTSTAAYFLRDRFGGFARIIGNKNIDVDIKNSDFLQECARAVGRVFADYHIWVGAIAGLALIYAAIRIRRYRDDS